MFLSIYSTSIKKLQLVEPYKTYGMSRKEKHKKTRQEIKQNQNINEIHRLTNNKNESCFGTF